MKPKAITVTANTQDRPATWEEVCRATFTSPDRIMELFETDGGLCEIDSESGGRVRFPAEEFQFFSILSDMQTSDVN